MSKYWDETPTLLSSSKAKLYAAEPFSPLAARSPAPFKRTPQMELGSSFHRVVEDMGLGSLVVSKFKTRSGKGYHAEKDRVEADGNILVLDSEYSQLRDMFDAFIRQSSRETLEAATKGEREVDMYTSERKILVDNVYNGVLRDWKTCTSVDPDFIVRQAHNLKYYIQQAHYSSTYEEITGDRPVFMFVYIQTSAPYEMVEVKFDHRFCDYGRIEYKKAWKRWDEYKDIPLESLKGYANGEVQSFSLPSWVTVHEPASSVFDD